jgi:selenocysteine lyase/cysteine desulfurase
MSTPPRIHVNYAGAGITSPAVDAAVRDYLTAERTLGPYEAEARLGEAVVEDARASIGRLLGCPASSVALFDNATRAWGTLVTGLPLRPTDTVWVSPYDYVGNLFVLTNLRRTTGLNVVPIPLAANGDLDLDWVGDNLTDEVALVSVTHVPSCAGVVSDVVGLGARLRGSRAMYIVDGCQGVGNVDIDVAAIGCDVYTGAGRKFLAGPRGTAFAAVSDRYVATARPVVLDVHAVDVSADLVPDIRVRTGVDLELAERNIAAWAGLRVAVDEHLAHGPETTQRRQRFLRRLESWVAETDGTRRLGDGSLRSGICSVLVADDSDGVEKVYHRLSERDVNAWVGHGNHTPLFAPGAGGAEFLRLSIGDRTTEDEIDRLLVELDAAVTATRSRS